MLTYIRKNPLVVAGVLLVIGVIVYMVVNPGGKAEEHQFQNSVGSGSAQSRGLNPGVPGPDIAGQPDDQNMVDGSLHAVSSNDMVRASASGVEANRRYAATSAGDPQLRQIVPTGLNPLRLSQSQHLSASQAAFIGDKSKGGVLGRQASRSFNFGGRGAPPVCASWNSSDRLTAGVNGEVAELMDDILSYMESGQCSLAPGNASANNYKSSSYPYTRCCQEYMNQVVDPVVYRSGV